MQNPLNTHTLYIYIYIYMICFRWILGHINHSRLFSAKSYLCIYNDYIYDSDIYLYIKYVYDSVWLGFVAYQPFVGYLQPNSLFIYIQLNGSKYCYVTQTIYNKLKYHDQKKKKQQTLARDIWKHLRAVSTLLGLIRSAYHDLSQCRSSHRPQNAEPKLYYTLDTTDSKLTSHGNCSAN